MPTERSSSVIQHQRGVTLLELMIFLVVMGVGLVGVLAAYNQAITHSVDPLQEVRALECAQAKLDEVLAAKYDNSSPPGGVPACGSAEAGAVACTGIVPDASFDDVGDFNGQVDTSMARCTVTTSVLAAGAELGIANDEARRIDVAVVSGTAEIHLSAYKVNF